MSKRDEETKRITAKIVSSIFQYLPQETKLSALEKMEGAVKQIVRKELTVDK